MTEEYAFCKSVTIDNVVEGPQFIEMAFWLKDHGLEKDFDYSVVRNFQLINGKFSHVINWTFHFDHARHAVMFKMVWGDRHGPIS